MRRMQGWHQIVFNLTKYLELIVEQEKKLSESLQKCFKELTHSLENTNDMFMPEESVQMIFKGITESQTKMAKERIKSAGMIEDQLLPILKELLVEIKRRAQDAGKDWGLLDQGLSTDLEKFVKHSTDVRKSLMGQQWRDPNDPKEQSRDPWLANLALRKHMDEAFKRQEDYRKKLQEQRESFSNFEKVIVQNIRVALTTFYEFRCTTFGQQYDLAKELKSSLERMNPENDWSLFEKNHGDRFIDENVPLVQIKDIEYDGCDDEAVRSVKEGPLLRKEGVFMRSYKPVYCVLTQSGYFHCLPPMNPGETFPDPNSELSLDLTECQLQPLMMNEKDPEEIAFIESSAGMFGRQVKHKIRGKGMAESAEWWGAINEQIRKQGKRPPRVHQVQEEAPPLPERDSRPQRSVDQKLNKVVQQREEPPALQSRPVEPTPNSLMNTPVQQSLMDTPVEMPEYEPSPLEKQFKAMNVADQMEFALRATVQPNALPEIETFTTEKKPASNPWATFQDDDHAGW
ncbi:hypothetical protein EDD86DRAFT_197099 [Gorgonomyces haynaldii]|nr:hypothetical protein EDD86DRAFT_197099 [Gorgonomyces haynaldii]